AGEDPLRRAAAGIHAAAQGDVLGGSAHAARNAAFRAAGGTGAGHGGGLWPAAQDAAAEPEENRRRIPAGKGRHRRRPPRRDAERGRVRVAGAGRHLTSARPAPPIAAMATIIHGGAFQTISPTKQASALP